ncbi:CoB--CoM heterodisulfide reductase iron-sulfur subunit B family protein [Desulfothermus okinawensis JCM 13304]
MMKINNLYQVTFFPGCSLTTSAQENYASLKIVYNKIGVYLKELDGWNCCGTSSAHSINLEIAIQLALRNIALAYEKKEMLIACPSCFLRLKYAHTITKQDPKKVDKFEKDFKVPFPHRLRLVHILEFLNEHKHKINPKIPLNGLIVAPYYGCMKNIPPKLREELFEPTLIESIIQVLGGRSIIWSDRTKCCGTFLAAVKPLEITKVINNIFKNAVNSNAQCIVTACSMCHLTLEMRSTIKDRIPVFHFSEILALSFGENSHIDWFNRHLIDPLPLLKKMGLISKS